MSTCPGTDHARSRVIDAWSDQLDVTSRFELDRIREGFDRARRRVAEWEPRPLT